jgi:anti-sigma factor RsiW
VIPRLEGLHLTDEEAEDFVRTALAGSELASVEEHLLACEHCQRRVEALDRFVVDLRAAAMRVSLWA